MTSYNIGDTSVNHASNLDQSAADLVLLSNSLGKSKKISEKLSKMLTGFDFVGFFFSCSFAFLYQYLKTSDHRLPEGFFFLEYPYITETLKVGEQFGSDS